AIDSRRARIRSRARIGPIARRIRCGDRRFRARRRQDADDDAADRRSASELRPAGGLLDGCAACTAGSWSLAYQPTSPIESEEIGLSISTRYVSKRFGALPRSTMSA